MPRKVAERIGSRLCIYGIPDCSGALEDGGRYSGWLKVIEPMLSRKAGLGVTLFAQLFGYHRLTLFQ